MSVSSHDSVGIPDNASRTLDRAHSAAYAYRRIYYRSSVLDADRSGRTDLFADPAGNAGIAAGFARGFSQLPVAAFCLDVVVRQYDLYEILRADAHAEPAADTFLSVNGRRAAAFDLYGRKMARCFA